MLRVRERSPDGGILRDRAKGTSIDEILRTGEFCEIKSLTQGV